MMDKLLSQFKKKDVLTGVFVALSMLFCVAFISIFVIPDYPLGSMVIYGLNGTESTGSRNVFLNLSYSSADGVDKCRWANDAAGNLISKHWEECTTVKAWILREGFGTKTVYFEVLDLNGDVSTFSDAIDYMFIQDFTAPTPPSVYDGISGDDIDWSDSSTTLEAHWFNATDDISTIFYKYRIINQSGCYNIDCNWTNVGTDTEAGRTNFTLYEGANYSFEVLAYVNDILNSSSVSDGVIVDLTKPVAPTINSSTHPTQIKPYDSATAIFNFSATDPVSNGVASGVEGFSYLLNRHPGTAPDRNIEERYWETFAEMHKGSYNQTLKTNGTGDAYSVMNELQYNITVGDSIRVRVALAEQFMDYSDLMGIKVYLAKDTGGAFDYDMESNAVSDISNMSLDIMYVEDISDAWVYQFDLTVTETIDIGSTPLYVVVSGITTDDDNREPLAISATENFALIDNTTKAYVCDETGLGCTEKTNDLEFAIEVKKEDTGSSWSVQYDLLGDETYYFHVKAKDVAGNWGDTAHYKIIVAAGGVNSIIYSPVDEELFYSNESEKNISVKVAVGGNVSVWVVALHPDGSNFTSPKQTFDSSYEFENIILETGINELYAVTNTSQGAIAESGRISVRLSPDVLPVTNKTLRVTYTGCSGSTSNYICTRTEGMSYVGIAFEDDVISGSKLQGDTSLNSIKIFMTRAFNTDERDLELATNVFMDRVNPMFGYAYGTTYYMIRNELRYDDLHLGGDFMLPPGVYKMYIRKGGVTAEGKTNISIRID